MRTGSILLLALLLSACAEGRLSGPGDFSGNKWDVDAVAAIAVNEDPYLGALQVGYIELARAELAESDWVDAAEFIERGRLAAAGEPVPPIDPVERNVSEDTAEVLLASRAELLGFLASEGAMLRAPRQIGDAQVKYDCWVQEAEEAHQSNEIAACKDGYEGLMLLVRDLGALPDNMAVVLPEKDGKIGGIELSQDGGTVTLDRAFAASGTGRKLGDLPVAEGEIRDAFAGALAARPKPPVEFVLTFDFNSSALDDQGYLDIAKAAEEALSRPAAEILVTGYADAPGDTRANLQLSQLRAERVRRELRRELGERSTGKNKVEVAASAKGEQGLIVRTNAPARPNRRVVVLVR